MAEQERYRHIPYDIEVEQALLGSFIIDQNSFWRATEVLKAEYFYDPLHERIFEQIAKMNARDEKITPLTLYALMKSDPGLAEVGGHAYFAGLAQAAPALANVRGYSNILRDLSIRRKIISVATEAVNQAYEPPDDMPPEAIAEKLTSDIYAAAAEVRKDEGFVSIRVLAQRAQDAAERAKAMPASACLTSGLYAVDEALGGLYRGDVTIIAGAPNQGKSALAEHIGMANAMLEEPEDVLFFTLEMMAEQIGARELASRTSVPSDLMRRGKISDHQLERLVWGAAQFPDLPLFIDGGRALSVAQMRARVKARKRKSNRGVGLVLIDHLRFIKPARPRDDEKDQIQQITRDLKDLAAEENVALGLVSHVNRDYAKRAGNRPQLSDLYGASAIEQNADAVWFLHREIYYLERNPPPASDTTAQGNWLHRCEKEKGFAEIFAAKQRMGPIGTARVKFNEQFTKFEDVDPPPTQEEMDLWKSMQQG